MEKCMKKISWLLLFTTTLSLANYDSKPLTPPKGGTGSTTQSSHKAVTTDSNGNIISTSSTTDTEIGYVNGVTSAIQTQINGLVPQTEVGAPSGVASLDSSQKVPVAQLPSVVMEYQGAWNPSTNIPALSDGTG